MNVAGVVFLNEVFKGTNSTTYRALRIATPAGDIVAGEIAGRIYRQPVLSLRGFSPGSSLLKAPRRPQGRWPRAALSQLVGPLARRLAGVRGDEVIGLLPRLVVGALSVR